MEFNKTNWKECLEALNFTECKNESFGGMVVYDDTLPAKDAVEWLEWTLYDYKCNGILG